MWYTSSTSVLTKGLKVRPLERTVVLLVAICANRQEQLPATITAICYIYNY